MTVDDAKSAFLAAASFDEARDPAYVKALLADLQSTEHHNGHSPHRPASDKVAAPAPDELSTWKPVDLTDALNGVDIPPPSIFQRSDNIHLLYAGRTHVFAGESESCKSWGAAVAAQQELDAERDVWWIDYEDDVNGIVSRLRALGVQRETIDRHLVYTRPEEPLRTRDGRATIGAVEFGATLASRQWSLIIIDGVTEAMTVEDLDIMSNSDIATWSRMLPKKCASTGAAVVSIDHVTKSAEGRGRYSIGGQHKLAGLTGCQYIFEVERALSRAKKDPVTGSIKIYVKKDRPGHVRTYARAEVIARLELTSYPDGGITTRLQPPDESGPAADEILSGRIFDYLTDYPGATQTKVETTVSGNAEMLRSTLATMVHSGWVKVERKGNGHYHTLTESGLAHFTEDEAGNGF